MTKRDVVKIALAHREPPYVPWSFGYTKEAREKLEAQYFPLSPVPAADPAALNEAGATTS